MLKKVHALVRRRLPPSTRKRFRRWVWWVIGAVALLDAVLWLLILHDGLRRLATPQTPEDFWAGIGAIANLVLLGVAFYGLKSLRLTRTGLLNQGQRDARACAIARCEEFASEIIPLHGPVSDTFSREKVPVFVTDPTSVDFAPASPDQLRRAHEWLEKVPPATSGECMRVLNRLEGWSMYFTQGLADHSIAFGPCAPFYCSIVVELYALLLMMRQQDNSGNYPNIEQLYKSWMAELEEHKRGLVEGELLQRIQELQARGTQSNRKRDAQYRLPDPIGTDLDD